MLENDLRSYQSPDLQFFLDKEKWQPLPVVTITEANEEAMSNKLFRRALLKVGLKPPANEQVC